MGTGAGNRPETARDTVGNSFLYSVTYTSTSSGINLRMEGKTLAMRVSGGRMTGSGSYDPGDGSTIRWTANLKGGSGVSSLGEMGSVAIAGTAVGVVGSVAGMAAAAVRPPRPVPFNPPAPDPGSMQPQGGVGVTYGPPDTPPPPTPPNGGETLNDANPHCPRCRQKTLPTRYRTAIGYRWQCNSPTCMGWLPWG